jgi:hypothetical protein
VWDSAERGAERFRREVMAQKAREDLFVNKRVRVVVETGAQPLEETLTNVDLQVIEGKVVLIGTGEDRHGPTIIDWSRVVGIYIA